MIFNNTGLTKDNIIFDFDISNIKSYNSNSGFTITSLTYWNNYALSDLTLTGYGQTMYDFGLTTSYTASKSYTVQNRNLVFNRIGYNDASGNTTFPQIILTTSSTVGNSFTLSGGYLTSFFKLSDKIFELAPYRNGVGFTIDTWIYVDNNSFNNINTYNDGAFLYLGTKSENKFNIKYSASTDSYTNSASTFYDSGFTYDTNNYLEDIEYNAIGFKFNNDRTISLRYLGISGLTNEITTHNSLTTTGWTNIATTFRYCDKIITQCGDETNPLIDCQPRREGNLKIFVNGKIFFEKDCIEEFLWLKDLNTNSDRQIGLPYSINWGGGSWGLKHSFLPSVTSYTAYSAVTTATTYVLASGATNILVNGNYGTFEGASGTTSGNTLGITSDIYNSILTATTAITYTGTNSLLLYGTTSFTFSTLTNNLVVFNTPINISANKTYIYQGKFYDDNSYISGLDKNVYLTFSGGLNSEITIVTSVTYTSETSAATWNDLKLIFTTPSGLTGTTSYTPIIKVDYTTGITAEYKFYFDEFSIAEYNLTNFTGLTGYSVTEQILFNKNLKSIIKDNFDGSFYGGIQKLRMYDKDLNFTEVKKNYNYFSTKYGFTKLK
jgi:hypothetical protein